MKNILDTAKARKLLGDDPSKLLGNYRYQSGLTKRLDKHDYSTLNRETFYQIILWKLNRFPIIDDALLKDLTQLRKLRVNQFRKAEELLRQLLYCEGIALAMASTILRFINPKVFQIIDDRAYRIVTNRAAKYPAKPSREHEKRYETYVQKSIAIYFDYLEQLHEVCTTRNIPFEKSDRILYLLDIKLGNKIGEK